MKKISVDYVPQSRFVNMFNVRTSPTEHLHFDWIDIEANDLKTGLGKNHAEWQSYVSKSHNADD
jgi:hypothetical protein